MTVKTQQKPVARFQSFSLEGGERPKKLYEYCVTGIGAFPGDMLRFDVCWPVSGDDAASMFLTIRDREEYRNPRSIKLRSYTEPTVARWSSFLWSVSVDKPGKPQEGDKYSHMANVAMAKLLREGEAIDVSECERDGEGHYILKEFVEDKDYCDMKTENWIWSVGRHLTTKEIKASLSADLYQRPDYECLYLR